ncbi:MAG TPA: hypothetical protein VKE69_00765 [Planctomycetota bacterium]|nr:hypothetical protein [Planctomycetota bacterium]
MRPGSAAAAIVGALFVLPSCAYLGDRARDAARVLEFDVGYGSGTQLHVGASHVVEAGLGWYSGRRFGLRDGGFVTLDEERGEFGFPILYLHEVGQTAIGGSMPGRARAGPLDSGYERLPLQWFTGELTDRDPLDLHLGVTVVAAGFNVSVRPWAFVDFVAGLVGLDLRNNDRKGRAATEFAGDLRSPDALERRQAVARIQEITGLRWPSYRTPPKRDAFSDDERAALAQIERDLGLNSQSDAASAPQPTAERVLPPSDEAPVPVASQPSEQR